MKVEIHVVSKDVISPSTPTPNDLKSFKLSYLDQRAPPMLMPHLMFYQTYDGLTNSEKSSRLKNSLSQTLSLYYPLAGRLVDSDDSVDCNDQGVTYIEAQVNCKLSDVVNEPIPEELNDFLPCNVDDVTDRCLAIQATFFACGGLAIALVISHKLADAWSTFMFLNSWAAASRGDRQIYSPKFDCATFFPPRVLVGRKPGDSTVAKENVITKRFVFSAIKINELKEKYKNHKNKEDSVRPTRILALSTFIWTRFLVSTQKIDDAKKNCIVSHSVSIRKKANPPLPNDLFGNLYLPAITISSLGDDKEVTYGMMEKFREAIDGVNGDFVRKVQEENDPLGIMNNQIQKVLGTGNVVMFCFSSICRFPLYEANFGWGEPVWVGPASRPMKNVVIFMDSYSCGGIEAWVHLKSEDMAKFGADTELLAYAGNCCCRFFITHRVCFLDTPSVLICCHSLT